MGVRYNLLVFAILAAVIGLLITSGVVGAQTGGDAIRGSALAESWCASCHIIDRKGTGTSIDPAPPFPTIAANPEKTSGYMKRWLTSSHPQMPNFNLGGREIDDLIAYIRSLGTK